MKTLTLKEAYAQATPGPLALGLETSDESAQIIAADGGHVAYVENSPEILNAALLTHAFNVLPDAAEIIEALVELVPQHPESAKLKARAYATLSKINTVQIP